MVTISIISWNSYFSKLLNYFEGKLLEDIVESEDENKKEPLLDHTKNQEIKHNKNDSKKCSTGIRYPPDIWFLIAKYIPPECLCTFSLICKDAYKVCLSVHFWKDLLKQ